jgi:hypothetical protein
VNDADGGGKTQLNGAAADDERLLGIADAAADDGVDVDVELGVVGEHLQLFIEHLERFL